MLFISLLSVDRWSCYLFWELWIANSCELLLSSSSWLQLCTFLVSSPFREGCLTPCPRLLQSPVLFIYTTYLFCLLRGYAIRYLHPFLLFPISDLSTQHSLKDSHLKGIQQTPVHRHMWTPNLSFIIELLEKEVSTCSLFLFLIYLLFPTLAFWLLIFHLIWPYFWNSAQGSHSDLGAPFNREHCL